MSKLLITGGSGFVGKHLVKASASHFEEVIAPTHAECDLEHPACIDYFQTVKPDFVIHCAGYNGGIHFNEMYPADIFRRNTAMALNVLEACRLAKVEKVLSLISSCAYPNKLETLHELDFFDGEPHDTVQCHAAAKRNLVLISRMYQQQYELNAVTVCLNTIYGPGDSVDPLRTKVGMAMVKRFVEAVRDKLHWVECWGSGAPLREFVYIEDAVELILSVFHLHNSSYLPLNLGTGQEISISNLATMIARLTGFQGEIRWLMNMPDGQSRKRLGLLRQESLLGVAPLENCTPLEEGFKKTIEWYKGLK